ncbi:MAG: protein kinase family protein [Parachlamydiaceae bacterium]|nr:protein kinase family protein [Parachlamydiaceae bacterium]
MSTGSLGRGGYSPPEFDPIKFTHPASDDLQDIPLSDSEQEPGIIEQPIKQSHIEAPIWHAKGKSRKVEKGEERVQLRGVQDSSLFVRKMAIPKNESRIMKFFRSFRWVRVSEGGVTLYLNINSLQKRLLISKTELEQVKKSGSLEGLTGKLTRVNEAMEEYKTHFAEYHARRPESRIVPSLLAKIVFASFDLVSSKSIQGKLEQSILIQEGSKKYLVKANGQEVHVILLSKKDLLGKGSFGKVLKVKNLADERFYALKIGRRVEQEAQKLSDLHNHLPHLEGVQAAPIMSGRLPLEDPEKIQEFMVGELYEATGAKTSESNLRAWMGSFEMTPETRVDFGKQIMARFQHLRDNRIYAGDVKAENIFISQEAGQQYPRLTVGDIAGAQSLDDLHGSLAINTPKYTPKVYEDLLDYGAFPQYKEIGARCLDRYAFGCLLFEVLTGADVLIPQNQEAINENREILIGLGYSEDVVDLVQRMISIQAPPNLGVLKEEDVQIDGLVSDLLSSGWTDQGIGRERNEEELL